jgi:PAS domain S-box-containing protein
MTTATKVRILRLVNYFVIFLLLAITGALAVATSQSLLTREYLFGGSGLLIILILIWFFIQRTLDNWLIAALNRSELGNDGTFDLLYSNSPVAYLTLDNSSTLIDYNAAAVRLLETTIPELKGKPFLSLCAPDYDYSILAGKIKNKLTINELELPLRTFTGSTVWVLLSVYALRQRGETLVTLVNITEQKKVDTAKSEFVALATHQLRTPIAAIRYAAELLTKHLNEGAAERNVAYVAKINRNVTRMLALINDFLNVSKLEMGTFATEVTTVNLTDFVTDMLDEFNDRINNQNISVARSDSPENLTIKTDPRLLNIIVSNIVSNAVKYTPHSGQVSLSFTEAGNKVRFEISDSGIGIPSNEIPQLFKKFFRASNATAQQAEGTGLGLYIVKQATEQLGGTLEVTSEVNVGTKFTVVLPKG